MIASRTARQARRALAPTLVLMVALGAVASGQSPSVPPSPSVAATTQVSIPCPSTSPAAPGGTPTTSTDPCVAAGAAFTWQQAAVPGTDAPGLYLTFMAVDSDGDMSLLGNAYPDQRKSTAWHSTDALTWTPADLVWTTKKDAGGVSGGIATVGDRFVAIGNTGDGLTALSPTGETWKVNKKGIEGTRRSALLGAITSTPSGAATGGSFWSSRTTTESVPAVWTSTDGKAWDRAELPGSGSPTTMAATPSGLLAAGAQGHQGKDESPALWVAPDGVTWQSVPLPFVDDESYLRSLTATASGLLLVLNQYRDKKAYAATIWSSTDGLTWQQVYSTEPFVASSSYGPLGVVMSTPTTLLRSVDDGATWSETPWPAVAEGSSITMLAQTPDGRLVVGFTTADRSSSSLWVGTPTQ